MMPCELKDVENARSMIEDLDNYLTQKQGASQLPLAYVTRDSMVLPADDPGYGNPNHIMEMIQCGDHLGNELYPGLQDCLGCGWLGPCEIVGSHMACVCV